MKCKICSTALKIMMYQQKCRPCFKKEQELVIKDLKAQRKVLKKKIDSIREMLDEEYIDWHKKCTEVINY